MGNPFCHVELNTTDPKKAENFYAHLFEWNMEAMQFGPDTYTLIKPGDGVGGGMMKHPVPGAPSTWLAYVLVDDVRATTAKAKSLGAQVLQDSVPVPGKGFFSIFIDPTGATLGIWQSTEK